MISRLAPANLRLLKITHGEYSIQGMNAFLASFPPSIDSLDLSLCHGMATEHLRALLQIPLRELFVNEAYVDREYRDEMNAIAEEAERLRGENKCSCSFG